MQCNSCFLPSFFSLKQKSSIPSRSLKKRRVTHENKAGFWYSADVQCLRRWEIWEKPTGPTDIRHWPGRKNWINCGCDMMTSFVLVHNFEILFLKLSRFVTWKPGCFQIYRVFFCLKVSESVWALYIIRAWYFLTVLYLKLKVPIASTRYCASRCALGITRCRWFPMQGYIAMHNI